jgi:hypothetical protein
MNVAAPTRRRGSDIALNKMERTDPALRDCYEVYEEGRGEVFCKFLSLAYSGVAATRLLRRHSSLVTWPA